MRTKEETVQEEKACRARCSCDETGRKEEGTLEVRTQSAQQLQGSGGLSGLHTNTDHSRIPTLSRSERPGSHIPSCSVIP